MAWKPGQKLQRSKYAIEKVLGQGGFGITYLVKDRQGNPFVIKTLNDYLERQYNFAKYQQDFINEALRLAKFRHPHIVRVDEIIQEGEQWCMVMEYIDGENLAHWVWHQGMLPELEALRYIQQVGEALTLVHNSGLLHRDIKPLNIMMRKSSLDAVLIDFGIAREFTPNLTQTHTQSLSEGFAPIEQYDWRAKRGAYTDIYALAATLYSLLTGEIPMPSPMRAYGMELAPPKRINPQISDRVNQAILQGMALKPEDRPQSVPEWLAMLDNTPVMPGLSPGDYVRLRSLLAAEAWQEADKETAALMLKASGREGWLRVADIEKFPAQELKIIDQIWREYSGDCFGLTVQKRIWHSLGDIKQTDWQAWCSFGDRVGWRWKGNWVSHDRLNFTPDAPLGELPSLVVSDSFRLRQQESVVSLLSRRDLE
ncbi:MAG TPA: serine/threonine protein kinase [Cyanobacteria bacterium UBA8803]|nr:serine/threonine protein kinase [Cyanobacteria bacterium UBA9273]HBL61460.1 serine/threonine protein kinase [Cyanobacteria bacterium UBA8803]